MFFHRLKIIHVVHMNVPFAGHILRLRWSFWLISNYTWGFFLKKKMFLFSYSTAIFLIFNSIKWVWRILIFQALNPGYSSRYVLFEWSIRTELLWHESGICCWECHSQPAEECGERIPEQVLGEMESKPHRTLVLFTRPFIYSNAMFL